MSEHPKPACTGCGTVFADPDGPVLCPNPQGIDVLHTYAPGAFDHWKAVAVDTRRGFRMELRPREDTAA